MLAKYQDVLLLLVDLLLPKYELLVLSLMLNYYSPCAQPCAYN